ncbi:hypothetical protein NDU88_008299 [Pleurodeles waltl]|uniref:Uncharacterized protein n=1 Tax=Pleurodeles waltl TaxID=8319 RepID=A0AAV7PRR3_PLEWA|nr:hypothetical protein NDU88_008299 [Pleurodeles waltl]
MSAHPRHNYMCMYARDAALQRHWVCVQFPRQNPVNAGLMLHERHEISFKSKLDAGRRGRSEAPGIPVKGEHVMCSVFVARGRREHSVPADTVLGPKVEEGEGVGGLEQRPRCRVPRTGRRTPGSRAGTNVKKARKAIGQGGGTEEPHCYLEKNPGAAPWAALNRKHRLNMDCGPQG